MASERRQPSRVHEINHAERRTHTHIQHRRASVPLVKQAPDLSGHLACRHRCMPRRAAAWRSTSARVLTALLRLDKPGPGIAARGAFDLGGQSMIVRTAYHFGDQPVETIARQTPPWQVWIQERFPVPSTRASAHDLRTRGGKKRDGATSAACLVVAHAYHAFPRSLWRADAGPWYRIAR
jgi:hypothetical protein